MNKLTAANTYIQKHKETVRNRPLFHFTPEVGWMNDPNGFSFYQGEYHLFYQYNPYDIVWNDMHWGHATTNDFVNWHHKPVALANDKLYDANGCFSGSAIEKDGKLFLMYTGHIDPNMGFDKDESQIIEHQCLAFSEDGIQFEKYQKNPIIGEKELPEGYMMCDFRDPKVLEVDGVYFCVLAVRNAERRGEIIMFQSLNLFDWTFYSSIYQSKFDENMMLECPDLFRVDGKDVLIFSIMPCDPKFQGEVIHKTAYVIGKMDYEKGSFELEHQGLLDYGHNFYAPQSAEGKNGERIIIGWMQRWNQAAPPRDYGFNGMMSLPRVLTLKDNKLIQRPIREIDSYFGHRTIHKNATLKMNETIDFHGGKAAYLRVNASILEKQKFQLELNKSEDKATRIHVDIENAMISFTSDYGEFSQIDISECCNALQEEVALEVFMDLHSIEVFINSGEKVLSFTAYDQEKGTDISIRGLSQTRLKEIVYATFKPEG
ncbi:glycoside hydrolase family 32 protein [Ectobacillus funiculus]|uniref:glycoside hydrolase family 32 protein n=1 Tax=Ectobacillus funiculus TaxID=137993 RepID=UPI0013ECD57F|nr:glycoside hydrolase family 32 protein [Ectobacillus funiculus]